MKLRWRRPIVAVFTLSLHENHSITADLTTTTQVFVLKLYSNQTSTIWHFVILISNNFEEFCWFLFGKFTFGLNLYLL